MTNDEAPPDEAMTGADRSSVMHARSPSAMRGDWRVNLRYLAAVLGHLDEADALLAAFDARVEELSACLEPA
ncbi:MAG: hypothetical protein OEY41_03040 [Acidimicrobiia bacterium]|nr:hypothetical protein [Acidimicrobiia bacterium]MDH4363016.1 hypothetical protein [Acidimicrobiia bacterium]MDH5288955.1 hypothetical protein [Acidimicrobiia bacterium]